MSAFTLRDDQKRAIANLRKHFVDLGHTRGKYISACGTGKTIVLSQMPQVLDAQTVVFLVPNLNLVSQSWDAFDRQLTGGFDGFIICSDDNRAKSKKQLTRKTDEPSEDGATEFDSEAFIASKGRGAVLRSPAEIAERLDAKPVDGPPTIIFCTYQSSHILREGIDLSASGTVDLMICDEAHKLTTTNRAGTLRGSTPADLTYPPRVVCKLIRAKRRIFATATPKVTSKTGEYSMDDASIFGTDAHVYSYAEAVMDGVVKPFNIVVAHVSADSSQAPQFLSRVSKLMSKNIYGQTMQSAITHEDIRSMTVADTVAKLRAAGTIDRVLTYSSRIDRAEQNAADINSIEPGAAQCLSSRNSTAQRIEGIRRLETGEIPVMTNCQLFGEGHDTPQLDAVAFIDPKSSVADNVQAIGRAVRNPIDPATGQPISSQPAVVIVPVDDFDYDQKGALIHRSDGKSALSQNRMSKKDQPFAVLESVLYALDSPGVQLQDCHGDFIKAMENKHVFPRFEQPPRFQHPDEDPQRPSQLTRNHEGLSAEELESMIGPVRSAVPTYTEDQLSAALPKITALNVLDPGSSSDPIQDRAEVFETLRRYIKVKQVDKTEIRDISLGQTAALELGRQYAESDLLADEKAATLWRTIDMLSTPVPRNTYVQSINRRERRTQEHNVAGQKVFALIETKQLQEPANHELIIHQLRQGLAYALHLAEFGIHPNQVTKRTTALHREAKGAYDMYARRAQRDWVSETERAIAEYAGFPV